MINLIDFENINSYRLIDLLNVCFEFSPELDFAASRIISDSISIEFKKESIMSTNNLKIEIKRSEDELSELWKTYKKFNKKHYIDILNKISIKLLELSKYENMGLSAYQLQFNSFYEKEYISEVDAFMHIFSELLLEVDNVYKEYWLRKYISSELSILTRSSIYLLRIMNAYSPLEKLEILRKNDIKIFTPELKEDLFMLYSEIFPKLENSEKENFINELMIEEKLSENYEDISYHYQKYNLLVWLKSFDDSNSYIDYNINSILKKYPYFEPRPYPQKSFWSITTSWGDDAPLPFSELDMVENLDDLFDELLTYSGDGFKYADRKTLITTIKQICSNDKKFQMKLIDKLILSQKYDNDLWRGVIYSIKDSNFGEEDFIEILDKLFLDSILKYNHYAVSDVIYSFIEERKEMSNELINYIYNRIIYLWPFTSNYGYEELSYMERSLNSSKGLVTLSTINVINFSIGNSGKKILEDRFKKFLEKIIHEKDDDSLVILLGNASFFFGLDENWCKNYILDKFTPDDERIFNIAWEGFVYQSYLYLEFALIMEQKFHNAIKNINLLEKDDLKSRMIGFYVAMMFNIGENPIDDYVPNIFTNKTTDYVIQRFYIELTKQIENLDSVGRIELLDKWILKFLERRTENLPSPINSKEKNLMLKFILNFPDSLKELDPVFKVLDEEFDVELNIIDYINYRIDINFNNSNIICKVLIIITSQIKNNTQSIIPPYLESEIKEIYQKLYSDTLEIKKLEDNLKSINILD